MMKLGDRCTVQRDQLSFNFMDIDPIFTGPDPWYDNIFLNVNKAWVGMSVGVAFSK